MEYNVLNEIKKYCNSFQNSRTASKPPPGVADEACRNSMSDIPGGFQDVPPVLFVVIGQILGNILAGNLPLNVQNSLGNWLGLVGQTIVTFAGQQQYFQGGPGRYYNPIYRNASNPFCENSGIDERGINDSGVKNLNSTIGSNFNAGDKILNLEKDIESLKKELEELKMVMKNT